VDASNIAFGQGISVTAIQLVTALSAIANQGVLMKPHVVKGLVNKKGEIIKIVSPTAVRQVIAPETARRLTAILTDVVGEDGGTGKKARIDNVAVAGKTGTSQKLDAARGVYSSARVRTSFMGFFPADDPQIAMLITLDEPQRDRWGGVAAAPVFKVIGEQILTRFKTDIRESPFTPTEEMVPPEAKVKLVSLGIPLSGASGLDTPVEESAMPDFRGLTLREALKISREKGIELKVQGSGWAMEQEPAPGTSLLACRSCTVLFGTGGPGHGF
jgi:cell division protein FtsI (penicillin-binding protein 3)